MEPYTITLSCMCPLHPPEFNSAWLILGLWMIDMIDTIDWHQKDGINIKTDLFSRFCFLWEGHYIYWYRGGAVPLFQIYYTKGLWVIYILLEYTDLKFRFCNANSCNLIWNMIISWVTVLVWYLILKDCEKI